MKIYHGGNKKIITPNLNIGRDNTDFGKGFYVTTDERMAKKWATRKSVPIINVYDLNISDLKIKQFGLDKEWLDFVINNRNRYTISPYYNDFDILTGTTADDKMFSTIENYEQGFMSANDTIAILNNMDIGIQICLKTQKAIDNLSFKNAYSLDYQSVLEFKEEIKRDRIEAESRTAQMLKEINHNRDNNSLDISKLSEQQIEKIKKIIEEEEELDLDI